MAGVQGTAALSALLLVLCLVCACSAQAKNTSKKHKSPGRHVCIENKVVTKPVKETESYCKPIYKSQMHPCEKDRNKFCTSFRVVYERAFRTVYKITATKEEHYACCPGWERHHPRAHGCNKPVCSQTCANGGTCAKPDHCICTDGWTGKHCLQDVNECKAEEQETFPAANCSQRCVNTMGGFLCACHEGFTLEQDGRTCRITINRIPELQEFIQGYEELSRKIQELETSRRNLTEIVQRLDDLSQAVSSLREEMQNTSPPPTTTSTTTTTTEPTTTTTTTTEAPTTTTTTAATSSEPASVSTESQDSRYGSPWDRINSLSDQIAMLEERLDDCTCDPVDGNRHLPPPVK